MRRTSGITHVRLWAAAIRPAFILIAAGLLSGRSNWAAGPERIRMVGLRWSALRQPVFTELPSKRQRQSTFPRGLQAKLAPLWIVALFAPTSDAPPSLRVLARSSLPSRRHVGCAQSQRLSRSTHAYLSLGHPSPAAVAASMSNAPSPLIEANLVDDGTAHQ